MLTNSCAKFAWKLKSIRLIACLLALFSVVFPSAHAGLVIELDYSYDSSNFFSSPQRRQILETAADSVNRWTDNLAAIESSPGNTWTGIVIRPDTGIGTFISGETLVVPQNTIKIYVGARNIGVNRLAAAERNAAIPTGTTAWQDLVRYRGQTGAALQQDYSLWGGSITFNPIFNWYDQTSATGIPANTYDLYSIAVHELLHVLGFGIAESFNTKIDAQNQFTGAHAATVGSPNNPELQLAPDWDHWSNETFSTIAGTPQVSVMNATFLPGQRYRMTDLDTAVLADIGWEKALAGDSNRDGVVDVNDMLTLVNNYGNTFAGWSAGDNNGDGIVDINDALAAVNNYGAGGTFADAAAAMNWVEAHVAAIPEPSISACVSTIICLIPIIAFIRSV
jgi:hypothetical protein